MYRKKIKGWQKHYDFILLDLVCLEAAFLIAFVLRRGVDDFMWKFQELYQSMAFFLVIEDIAMLIFLGTLKNVLKRGAYQEFIATFKHTAVVELIAILYLFAIKEGGNYSRMVMFLTGIVYIVLTYALRCLWKGHLRKRMKEGEGNRSLLIVTTLDLAQDVVDDIKAHNYEMFHIVGLVITDHDMSGQTIDGVPIVSDITGAANYVCRAWVDEILVVPAAQYQYPQAIIDQFIETGVTVHVSLAKAEQTKGQKQLVEQIGDYTVLTTSVNVAATSQLILKRLLDIVGGLVGCLLTLIILVIVGPIIYIKSPGPIIFSQIRVGKNGKKFKIYKIRSMYLDAEERKKELMAANRVKDGMMFKLDFDTRIIGNEILPDGTTKTGIGNFIRATSLDEFPQFFNVLKGDMSLVGTRPPTLDEWEKYELHHKARLATKPGITGMWQVSGRSNITDFEEVVDLDMQYITEWSIGQDIKILCKTVSSVLRRDGSM